MTLRDYLKTAGYEPIDEAYDLLVRQWKAWYAGHVDSFHNYTISNGGQTLRRSRARLNMAKHGCEYWANLLWNNNCHVNLADAASDAYVNGVLRENDFTRQTNVLIERAFALGSGAYLAYEGGADLEPARRASGFGRPRGAGESAGTDGGVPGIGGIGGAGVSRTVIDYVTADSVYPLAWRGDEIESCAFASAYTAGRKRLVYLMIHERQPGGKYRIYNRYFEQSRSGNLTPVAAPPDVLEEYEAGVCRFAVIKPNIANNAMAVPVGLSVYANCIDTLKSIDLAYDGIKTSMEIGRPRIGVSSNMLTVSGDGQLRPVFDPADIAVYDLGGDDPEGGVAVKDLTTPYRAKEYEESLQAQLLVYARSIGLGDNAFKWHRAVGDVARTATEVIATNSEMLRAMEKHQDGLRPAVTRIVRAVLELGGRDPMQEIAIVLDDSVARDRGREALEAWAWVVAGKYPFWRYLVDYKGYDEVEAKAIDAER